MRSDLHRPLRVFGIVIAVLLVGLAFYPGTFAGPDTVPDYTYSVTPESTADYDHRVDRIEVQHGSDPIVYSYADLSPLVQNLFDETRALDVDETYRTPVCTDYLLFCDGPSRNDLLDTEFRAFSLAEDVQTRDAFVFIDHDDTQYLLIMTQPPGHTESRYLFHLLLVGLTLLPLSLFVAMVSLQSQRERVIAATISGGILVGLIGVTAGTIEGLGLLSISTLLGLILVVVWLSILSVLGYRLYQVTR